MVILFHCKPIQKTLYSQIVLARQIYELIPFMVSYEPSFQQFLCCNGQKTGDEAIRIRLFRKQNNVYKIIYKALHRISIFKTGSNFAENMRISGHFVMCYEPNSYSFCSKSQHKITQQNMQDE